MRPCCPTSSFASMIMIEPATQISPSHMSILLCVLETKSVQFLFYSSTTILDPNTILTLPLSPSPAMNLLQNLNSNSLFTVEDIHHPLHQYFLHTINTPGWYLTCTYQKSTPCSRTPTLNVFPPPTTYTDFVHRTQHYSGSLSPGLLNGASFSTVLSLCQKV